MRAVSSVVDATLCLLLLSGAVLTLTLYQPERPAEATVDETAETLATTTTTVDYTVPVGGVGTSGASAGTSGGSSPGTSGAFVPATDEARSAYGTHAGLLGRAALGNLSLAGQPLSSVAGSYVAAIENETLAVLNRSGDSIQVRARWEPYPGAPLTGTVEVGQAPPPTVDVEAATVTVPAPLEGDPPTVRSGPGAGFDRLGRYVAHEVIDAIGAPGSVAAGAGGRAPTRLAIEQRYRTIGQESGESIASDPATGTTDAIGGLASVLAADMRDRFDDPATARSALRTDQVRITVRRWDA